MTPGKELSLKANLGSERYQSMNSQMACSYERFELADLRLFKTTDFDCSRSGNLRTVFGMLDAPHNACVRLLAPPPPS